MALVWGVGETIAAEYVEAVRNFLEEVIGREIKLDTGEVVTIIKADIREKKNESMLIYRYQLISSS